MNLIPIEVPMSVSSDSLTIPMNVSTAIVNEGDVTVQPLSVTENGTYREEGKAYSPVDVNVPEPSGSISITENGSVDVTDYETANVNVRQPSGTKQISITQNGTTTEDVEWYEDAELTVNVPNTYTASDEGKVVSSGALVGQTSRNVTANGTVDTTLNNEVVVNVPNTYTQADEGKVVSNGSLVAQISDTVTENGTLDTTLINSLLVNVTGGGGFEYETGTYEPTENSLPTILFANQHLTAPTIVIFSDASETMTATGTRLLNFTYINSASLFGASIPLYDAGVGYYVRAAANSATAAGGYKYDRGEVTNVGFTPYPGGNYLCRVGETYKWIAIWT